jgi:hypothetical protein
MYLYIIFHFQFVIHVQTINVIDKKMQSCHFLIRKVGGGIHLVPLGMSATNWAIVPALGHYEEGEFCEIMIGRVNRSTRRKPAQLPLCPPQIPHELSGHEHEPRQWEASD